MLYLDGTFFSPPPSVLTGNSFEELGGVFVPHVERFHDEGLEEATSTSTLKNILRINNKSYYLLLKHVVSPQVKGERTEPAIEAEDLPPQRFSMKRSIFSVRSIPSALQSKQSVFEARRIASNPSRFASFTSSWGQGGLLLSERLSSRTTPPPSKGLKKKQKRGKPTSFDEEEEEIRVDQVKRVRSID